jgi:hypothetical protein
MVLLYQPLMIDEYRALVKWQLERDKQNVHKHNFPQNANRALVKWQLERDKQNVHKNNFCPNTNLSIMNRSWNSLKLNPGLCSEKLATNFLICCTETSIFVVIDHSDFCVGFEVLIAVPMNNTVFGDMKPCGPLEVH